MRDRLAFTLKLECNIEIIKSHLRKGYLTIMKVSKSTLKKVLAMGLCASAITGILAGCGAEGGNEPATSGNTDSSSASTATVKTMTFWRLSGTNQPGCCRWLEQLVHLPLWYRREPVHIGRESVRTAVPV